MEISFNIPPSYPFSPALDTHAPQAAAENARKKGRADNAVVARDTSKNTPEQTAQTQADALRAAREKQSQQSNNIAGTIQFESEEGSRVMKVLDSKDVLIYQVPSKGELALIKAEEAAARRILASA